MMLQRLVGFVALLVASACGDDGPETYGDDLGDVNMPPRGWKDVQSWLEAGHYLSWTCEAEPHAGRAHSPHGRNRICNNPPLAAAPEGDPYPVGSASVKEIYDGAGNLELFAVYRKVDAAGGPAGWYWYEGAGVDIAANGERETKCTGCHERAPQEYVFTIVED